MLTIADLIANGTLSAGMAALLWSAVDEKKSFLTVAVPRFAGKSTTSNAVLALRPPDVALHQVDGRPEVMEALKRDRLGGYLVVAEFSQAPVPGYIWGEPVRRVFDTLSAGYALHSALHAPGVTEAIAVLVDGNGVSDQQASTIDLVMYIERFGDDMSNFWRRVAELYEVDRVENGRPVGRTLYRWREAGDEFEAVEKPHHFALDEADLAARTQLLEDLVRSGRTAEADLAAAVGAYREEKAR